MKRSQRITWKLFFHKSFSFFFLTATRLISKLTVTDDKSQDPADDIPLQHLRAAEQHLAALERWLRGEGPDLTSRWLNNPLAICSTYGIMAHLR